MEQDTIDTALSAGRSGWQRLGAHSIRFEAPDLVFLRVVGDVSPDQLTHLFAALRRLSSRAGGVCWLIDMTHLGEMPLATRKAARWHGLDGQLHATAMFGASLLQRAMATLTIHAGRLSNRGNGHHKTRFFTSESEARAWLDGVRPTPHQLGPTE
ncbi:uncharacterized protein CMC5_064230 [Chondromyces crocatus]|uniref:STAS/SEC14 domain-containing protein n=2 Tax=Chondromyces crocatus TaxID=52 RepID=A0A0K1EMS6_CHOCO|nr:uncharacterized protein CMC5_064230 [Chondromyces crocatus]